MDDLGVIINAKGVAFLGYDSPQAAVGQKVRAANTNPAQSLKYE